MWATSQPALVPTEGIDDLSVVNYVCEIAFSRRVGGIYSGFLSTLDAVNRTGQFRCQTNRLRSKGILHAHTSGPLYWILRALHQGRVVVHAHVVPETFIGQVKGASFYMPLLKRYLRSFFNSADVVICMTDKLRQDLVELGVTSRMLVLRYALDFSTFQRSARLRRLGRDRLGLKPSQRMVLGVGMVVPRKGIFDFGKVAEMNPDIEFCWAGDVPHGSATASRSAVDRLMHAPIPNLHFLGVVGFTELVELYNAADLFFFPSEQETFGLAIAEAAACGLPLVLRDLETYHESFGTAYLAGGNPKEFSELIRQSIFSSPTLLELGEQARAAVLPHDSAQVAASLTGLYDELLSGQAAVLSRS